MKITDQFFRLDRLIDLIRRKATGCPKELAQRLEVSERTVFNLIDCLREFGIPVEYDEHKRTYIFPEGAEVEFKLVVKTPDCNQLRGGHNFFSNSFYDCNFLAVRASNFDPVILQ